MKVRTTHYNNEKEIHIGEGNSLQKNVFSKGQSFKKISENRYFNSNEIIFCVGFIDDTAYFTSKRLQSIHEKRYKNGESLISGIPLLEGEVFIFL